jgi:hypothetical protein
MPAQIESALMNAAGKLAASGKLKSKKKYKNLEEAKKGFTFSTLTNMQKAGKIKPWRKLNK